MKDTIKPGSEETREQRSGADSLPVTAEGATLLLASDRAEGIGKSYAQKIVERLGTDAPSLIAAYTEEDPDGLARRLAGTGIGPARLAKAAESLRKSKADLNLIAFLFSCGVGETYTDRILGKYRSRTRKIVTEDPYSMVEDVWQLSFFTADKIGRALAIPRDDPGRLAAALVTAVKHAAEAGHLFSSPKEAAAEAARISGIPAETISEAIPATVANRRLVESRGGLYLPVFYRAEKDGASRLATLASATLPKADDTEIPAKSIFGHTYSPPQREAIRMAIESPVTVITGGPGSGKTTVVRGVIEILEKQGKKVVLAAPTGRAAKRLSTLTGHAASTIHSLLGYRQGEGYAKKEIDADMLVIDEGSMMEQVLFNHLLEALRPGTRILLVGDVDQLPAIGAGDVLRDMIESGVVAVASLDENFRQAEGSLIASGARAINEGRIPPSDPQKDFIIIPEPSAEEIHARIIRLVAEELPRERGIDPRDILVVTPQQIGILGARRMNEDLQHKLNPEGPALRRGAVTMRLGDPVMQTANSRERGVFNGETGRISQVWPEQQKLEVTFSGGRRSTYARSELSELVLAYATTVHKLQGSEAPNVIIPVTMAHRPMLYRNLLYTGVSRATDLCILVGEEEALRYAIANTPAATRNSNFALRLAEKPLLSQLPSPDEK